MIRDASFCRDQAQLHQDRADAADLPNVRSVELTAALSWRKEADVAHRLETLRYRRGAAGILLY